MGDITSYNGAAIIAMAGKNCVAIASDLRFGVQLCTMAMDFKKVFQIHDKCFVGLAGLATDMQTLCVALAHVLLVEQPSPPPRAAAHAARAPRGGAARRGGRRARQNLGLRASPAAPRAHNRRARGCVARSRRLQRFQFRHNLYKLREDRDMKPSVFANFVSNLLYEKRFGPYFCEPVIAGLEPDGTPYITGMDLIGAMAPADNFIVSGTANESLLGACESLYREDLEPEELFEVISQAMLSTLGRDSMSGWGAVVNVITMDGVITRTIRTRMD